MPSALRSATATAATPSKAVAVKKDEPVNEIPELDTYKATTIDEKISGLKLVTDAIAQQRQTASRSILYHPATIAAMVLAVSIVTHFLYNSVHDLPAVGCTCIGIFMALLVLIQKYTQPYLDEAEAMNWDWMKNADGVQDQMYVTQYGKEVIGTTIVRLTAPVKKTKKDAAVAGRAEIRGWAVRMRYRNKGIGGDLLRETIRQVKKQLGEDAEIVFAKDHAAHYRPLYRTFNAPMDRDEARAKVSLQKAVAEYETGAAKK